MRGIHVIVFAIVLGIGATSFAADDPSITGNTRQGIQLAMKNHIDENLADGKYVIYDAVQGELKRLRFESVHKGIVKKGGFYISCADFVDERGRLYDLDLLVVQKGGKFRVLEAVVHAIDGKKRKYHVEGS